jgi:hypothetical protein
MHAGFSFSYPPISLLLRQPLSIKKSYAGAIQDITVWHDLLRDPKGLMIRNRGGSTTGILSLSTRDYFFVHESVHCVPACVKLSHAHRGPGRYRTWARPLLFSIMIFVEVRPGVLPVGHEEQRVGPGGLLIHPAGKEPGPGAGHHQQARHLVLLHASGLL